MELQLVGTCTSYYCNILRQSIWWLSLINSCICSILLHSTEHLYIILASTQYSKNKLQLACCKTKIHTWRQHEYEQFKGERLEIITCQRFRGKKERGERSRGDGLREGHLLNSHVAQRWESERGDHLCSCTPLPPLKVFARTRTIWRRVTGTSGGERAHLQWEYLHVNGARAA